MGPRRGDAPQDPGRQSGATLRFLRVIEAPGQRGGGAAPGSGWGWNRADAIVWPVGLAIGADARARGVGMRDGAPAYRRPVRRRPCSAVRPRALSAFLARGGGADRAA